MIIIGIMWPWSQSRVLFVSPKFTNYQREAINFKDLPIELWEVKRFENETVSLEQIQKADAQESIKTISKADETIDKIAKKIKVYSESEHLERAADENKELYEKVKNALLNLGDLEVKPKKKYVAFVSGTNVVDVQVQKSAIKLHINLKKGELEDSKKLTRDVSNIGHYGNGDYQLQFSNDDDLELTPIFEEHIDTSAKIFTDKWRGYEPLKKKYNITQIKSNNGKNFKKLHVIIHQVKSWLRTIPTHVSKSHIQKYFDEFAYRINRSQSKNTIWHNTIIKMVKHKPITQKQIVWKLN